MRRKNNTFKFVTILLGNRWSRINVYPKKKKKKAIFCYLFQKKKILRRKNNAFKFATLLLGNRWSRINVYPQKEKKEKKEEEVH